MLRKQFLSILRSGDIPMSRRILFLWTLTLGTLAGLTGAARADWRALHNADAAGYQKFVNDITAASFRMTLVNVHSIGGKPIFAAIAVKDGHNYAWTARHGLSTAEYQKAFNEWSGKGYRLTS